MLDNFNPENDLKYLSFMFRHHCESLKKGVPISQFDVNKNSIFLITTIDELIEDFDNLDLEIKLKIKEDFGL